MANSIVSRGKTGYPELGLGVFDPLRVDKMLIHQKTGPVLLKIDLKNFKFGGLSDIKFSKVDGFRREFEKAKIEMKFIYPVLNFNGPYKLEGKVLILPVAGSGICNMTFCEFFCCCYNKFCR
jgi:Haemolymph juvenile hormone binding protein (JHBP)